MIESSRFVRWVLMLVTLWFSLTGIRTFAAHGAETAGIKKKRIVYRSHTQVDLSGETVQGKIRAPEVFYIFQRKRSQAHHVVQTPENFDYHTGDVRETLARSLPK